MGCLLFIVICVKNRFVIDKKLFFIIAIMIVTCIFNSGTFYIFLSKAATIIVGYYIARYMDTKKIVDYFVNIMFLIAIFSIIGYLFPQVFTSLPLPLIKTSTRGNTFVFAFFTNVPTQSWIQSRNYGPFWEPGAFEAFLNIDIFFLLFYSEVSNRKKILYVLIDIVAIITTLSTTGLMALPFFLVAYLFKIRGESDGIISKIMISLLLIVATVYILGDSGIFTNNLLLKLQNEDTSRFLFPKYGIIAGLRNPFFGLGGQAEAAISELSGGANISFTNTIIAHFVRFGILITIYYLACNYKMIKSIVGRNRTSTLLCVVGFVMLLSGEYYFYSPLFALLMYLRSNNLATSMEETDD